MRAILAAFFVFVFLSVPASARGIWNVAFPSGQFSHANIRQAWAFGQPALRFPRREHLHSIAAMRNVSGDGSMRRRHQLVKVAKPHTGGALRVHGLSRECHIALSLGGPCGCWASEHFFGHSDRNLWLADAWLKFPRTSPRAGVAAVWPGRHVAPVVEARDGRVLVADSWATHWVDDHNLVFVDPQGTYAAPSPASILLFVLI
jgi:hypothetical protein